MTRSTPLRAAASPIAAPAETPAVSAVGHTARHEIALRLLSYFTDVPSVEGYKDKRMWVTTALASDLSKLTYSGQRNLRLDQIRTLKTAMTDDQYAPNNVIALSYNPDDPTDTSMVSLINGQHTVYSILGSNTTQPLIVSLFPCRSRKDIEFHYALFDQGRARNQQDVSRATGLADTIRHHSLPRQALNALGAAAALIRAHLKDARLVPKNKLLNARISRDWMPEAAGVYRLIAAPDRRSNPEARALGDLGKLFRKRLVSPSFFAVALVAMRSHPDETAATLTALLAVADGADHGEPGTDQFVWDVVDFLTETSLGSGTDRRIATRNFIHLLAELRNRRRLGVGGSGDAWAASVGDIIIDATPSINESEALWDILTEDRIARSVANG